MSNSDLDSFENLSTNTQPPSDVVAFNELRSCADLYRLYKEGVLDIQPSFQRDVVWNRTEQSTFIDSLIKQLPIPSMCFSLDHKSQKWQVVDGLQRMTAIVSFLNDDNEWRLSRLLDIDPRISGKTNRDIKDGDTDSQILYRRIQNLSLPITVIRCDYSKESHAEYLFTIFHRLNAGGVRLNNQEIRNCIFTGPFNELLRSLDRAENWSAIKNLLPSKGSRFRSIELILRFFALHQLAEKYSGNLAAFLNSYMREHRSADAATRESFESLFNETVAVLAKAVSNVKPSKVTYTLIETAMLGIGSNVKKLTNVDDNQLGQRLKNLMEASSISGEALKFDTTATEKVKLRVAQARTIFG